LYNFGPILYNSVPLCTTLYHFVPLFTTLYHFVSLGATCYRFVSLCTTLRNFIPLCTTLYNSVPLCIILYHFVQLCTTLDNFMRLCTFCITLYHFVTLCTTLYNLVPLHSTLYHRKSHEFTGTYSISLCFPSASQGKRENLPGPQGERERPDAELLGEFPHYNQTVRTHAPHGMTRNDFPVGLTPNLRYIIESLSLLLCLCIMYMFFYIIHIYIQYIYIYIYYIYVPYIYIYIYMCVDIATIVSRCLINICMCMPTHWCSDVLRASSVTWLVPDDETCGNRICLTAWVFHSINLHIQPTSNWLTTNEQTRHLHAFIQVVQIEFDHLSYQAFARLCCCWFVEYICIYIYTHIRLPLSLSLSLSIYISIYLYIYILYIRSNTHFRIWLLI